MRKKYLIDAAAKLAMQYDRGATGIRQNTREKPHWGTKASGLEF